MKQSFLAALLLSAATAAHAGDYVTNTNQSIAFLRNPARNATHAIDALYYNPAGAGFFSQGWAFSINSQTAFQTRNITTTFAPFTLNADGRSAADGTRHYKGTASAPMVPSAYAAYTTGRWTFGANFALLGGGGKAKFAHGLPNFEMGVVGNFAPVRSNLGGNLVNLGNGIHQLLGGVDQLVQAGVIPSAVLAAAGIDATTFANLRTSASQLQNDGYDLARAPYSYNAHMQGRQYVFGLTLGTAYRVNDNFSVYGGLRLNYATAHYEGVLGNPTLHDKGSLANAQTALHSINAELAKFEPLVAALTGGGATNPALSAAAQGYKQAKEGAKQLAQGAAMASHQLQAASQSVRELDVNQKDFAISPIIGVNYVVGDFSLAAKYEFKTALKLRNKTKTNTIGLAEYRDGGIVRADIPAMLSLGAEYKGLANTRLSAGYHYYFDKDAKWGADASRQKTISGNTNEFLLGVEYDFSDKLTASVGGQMTNYGLTDQYQQATSFSCDSYSLGLGVAYKITPKINLNLAYFTTFYSDYKSGSLNNLPAPTTYERTNHVIGVGVDFKL